MSYINNINNNFINNVHSKGAAKRDDITNKPEEKEVQNEVRPQAKQQLSASDVLSFMANSAIYTQVAATKQINPAKYVTPEQKADIAKSMENFESKFENYFNSIISEVPELGESAAMTLASKMIEDEI